MSAPTRHEPPAGLLLLDKPKGPTSHDAVGLVRRTLGVRRVGHAGTLDPAATGLLVIMVGPATKLAPFLSMADKRYRATVELGTSTNTLDAEGEITARGELPRWCHEGGALREHIEAALALERTRTEQHPPTFSAIKICGRAAYARARAGEQVELEPRPVKVHELELVAQQPAAGAGAEPPSTSGQAARFTLELRVGKGYYVRSLARDLGQRLAVEAHLAALRRTGSAPFDLRAAVRWDATVGQLRAALIDLATAARQVLPEATLTEDGARRARFGQALEASDFSTPPAHHGPAAWFDPEGRLVAVGERGTDDKAVVLRGFG